MNTQWFQLAEPNTNFFIEPDMCMFYIPNVAIYLIKEGNNIIISPIQGACEDLIRLYILGTCMGVIAMQRKILPLHGSAIAIEGKAYAIVGESGAGKSTLAASLLTRGYKLLSDDVIPVILSEDNIPIVVPAYPQQKLWLESINQFEMKAELYRPITDRETKFAIPVATKFASEPLPLAGVFELVKSEKEEISIQPIQKLEGLHTLFNHTYRNFILNRSGLMEWHFNTTSKIVNNINLYKICRPLSRFTANDLTSLLLNTVDVEGKKHEY